MTTDLVIDIGNSRIKAALFQEDRLVGTRSVNTDAFSSEVLDQWINGKPIDHLLISSVNQKAENLLKEALEIRKQAYTILDFSTVKMRLDVDEPEALGHDRIANAYGALSHFPINDCIIIDIGTAVTADLVTKDGSYAGGMIYPGPALSAKALADYTDKLPLATVTKPDSPLGKTTMAHLQSGIYYGLLGAVERLIAELRLTAPSPSSIKVLATGGFTTTEGIAEDLTELVDLIDPNLTLVGLHEIQKELNTKK